MLELHFFNVTLFTHINSDSGFKSTLRLDLNTPKPRPESENLRRFPRPESKNLRRFSDWVRGLGVLVEVQPQGFHAVSVRQRKSHDDRVPRALDRLLSRSSHLMCLTQ